MSRRRACLVVPAAPAAKLAKGAALAADEVVLDLEDAVVPAAKDEARGAVVEALGGRVGGGVGRGARQRDRHAVVPPRPRRAGGERRASALTAVLPKVEHPRDLAFADRLLDGRGGGGGPRDAGAAARADRDRRGARGRRARSRARRSASTG